MVTPRPNHFFLPSQGRLPTDNPAIDKAFEVAMLECLRSIQKTSPSLLLTAQQLKKAEQDARYVPAVATSLASIIAKSRNDNFRQMMTKVINNWAANTGTSDGQAGEGGDGGSNHSWQGGANHNTSMVAKEGEDDAHEDGSSDDDDEKEEREQDGANNRVVSRSQLLQSLSESIGTRLRRIVAAHDEAPRQRNRPGRMDKTAKDDNVKEGEDDTGSVTSGNRENVDERSQSSDGFLSFDFSAASNDDEHQQVSPLLQRKNVRSGASLGSYQSLHDIAGFDSASEDSHPLPREIAVDASGSQPGNDSPAQNIFDDNDDDWWPE
jgi:hypothetical protein